VSSVPETQSIGSLNRITDEDAARVVSAQALAELEAAITAIPIEPARGRRSPSVVPRRGRRPVLVLAAAVAIAAVILGVTGALSGGGPAQVQPAEAAVLRGALAALQPPAGSIVIESYRSVQRTNPKLMTWASGHTPPRGIQVVRWSQSEITETPHGNGPPNEVNLGGPSVNGGVQIGEVNGNNELYDPANNTVYISSDYGADISAGKRPGTFVYTLPKSPNAPAGSAAAEQNAHMPPPLTITAAQANALRDGTAMVDVVPDNRHGSATHLTITAAYRLTDETAQIRSQLKAGKLELAGSTTIDGRRALKLVAVHGIDEYDVAPETYVPIRTVLGYGAAITVTTTYSEYRILPATAANDRLLDLTYRHPGARIDRSHADYLAAQARLITGS
jgi:hypothetical protein